MTQTLNRLFPLILIVTIIGLLLFMKDWIPAVRLQFMTEEEKIQYLIQQHQEQVHYFRERVKSGDVSTVQSLMKKYDFRDLHKEITTLEEESAKNPDPKQKESLKNLQWFRDYVQWTTDDLRDYDEIRRLALESGNQEMLKILEDYPGKQSPFPQETIP